MQRDYWYTVARSPAALEPAAEVGRKAGERTLARLGARRITTRQAAVIFQAEMAVSLLRNLIGFYVIMEGLFFYVGFVQMLSLGRRNKMVGAADSEEFRKRLLYEAGVAVLADIHFGEPVKGDGEHLRFSYASSFEAIDEGLGRVRDFMAQNKR